MEFERILAGARLCKCWDLQVFNFDFQTTQNNLRKNDSELLRWSYKSVLWRLETKISEFWGGWGSESNREIVSFRFVSFVRACVCAVCLPTSSERRSQEYCVAFPFSFLKRQTFPCPCVAPTTKLFAGTNSYKNVVVGQASPGGDWFDLNALCWGLAGL